MTTYFNDFPTIVYNIGDRDFVSLTDISRNVRIKNALRLSSYSYDEYIMRDGETPEDVSLALYGTQEYYWIVMLVNERFDRIHDFVMRPSALRKYIASKYGDTAEDIKYYVDSETGVETSGDSVEINGQTSTPIPITNSRYEEIRNEANRTIRIPSRQAIESILRQFKDLI